MARFKPLAQACSLAGPFTNQDSMSCLSLGVKAYCYQLRNPGRGQKPLPYSKIAEKVFFDDGKTHPTPMGVWKAVRDYKTAKNSVGRGDGGGGEGYFIN